MDKTWLRRAALLGGIAVIILLRVLVFRKRRRYRSSAGSRARGSNYRGSRR